MRVTPKVCTRCLILKPVNEFRVRQKRGYSYLNPTCKLCDSAIAKERHAKKKDNEDYRTANAKRVREYYYNNEEKRIDRIEKNRAKRKKEGYRDYVKSYREKNLEKILAQEKITKGRYGEKNKDALSKRSAEQSCKARKELTDYYVRGQIKRLGKEITPESIKKKKADILTHRIKTIINQLKDEPDNRP